MFHPYPTPITKVSGCKVAWYTYSTREDAEQASVAAQANASLKGGYRFGQAKPGEITENGDTFTVTIP